MLVLRLAVPSQASLGPLTQSQTPVWLYAVVWWGLTEVANFLTNSSGREGCTALELFVRLRQTFLVRGRLFRSRDYKACLAYLIKVSSIKKVTVLMVHLAKAVT